ncbi:pol-like protein [Lasius niger]|uniref:Pol-like protein n=1 Tax=Lasius niger TaxID=67767 RepID=A0A0J7MXM1_LASNI|nr:pol-like protein [Lasius niger]
MLHCIEFILTKNILEASIFTDSRSLVEAISSSFFKNHNILVVKIKDNLRIAKTHNVNIVIAWIPSHMGILGNEAADHLAKRAIRFGNMLYEPIPHSDFYSVPRLKLHEDSPAPT